MKKLSLLFTFSLLLLTSVARAETIDVLEAPSVNPSDRHGIVVPGPVRIVPVR